MPPLLRISYKPPSTTFSSPRNSSTITQLENEVSMRMRGGGQQATSPEFLVQMGSFLLQHQRTIRNLVYQFKEEEPSDMLTTKSSTLPPPSSHPSNSCILPLPRISFKPPSMSFSSPKTKLQTSTPLSLNSKIEESLFHHHLTWRSNLFLATSSQPPSLCSVSPGTALPE